ncbi:hypothetical protein ACI2UK_13420 [Ralstonia nicotianae]|uniref:hypothetical protein n=1 Tax=Ralstonia pseudosolanacearum TaxID=1310165 RepID=UPI0020046C68|nr:hypothetical protein [Ralstonia pseudosolanacearum]MCK4118456.1 hypothetical protein [Ralstonia pseudosolanacearum]
MNGECIADAHQLPPENLGNERCSAKAEVVYSIDAPSWVRSTRTNRPQTLSGGDLVAPRGISNYLSAQTYAFGGLLLILSFVTAVAMLVKRRPPHMERAICAVLGALVDWRMWAALSVGLVVVALVHVLRQLQR